MANKLRNLLTHTFAPATQADIEALTQRLGVEREKRAELKAAVAGAALQVAKAGGVDLSSVIDANASVAAQDQLIQAVEQLLAEAQQAERDRQREVAIKGAKSRVAAIRQHLSKRERLAVEYQAAVRTIATVYREFQENAEQIEKLSPPYPFFLHSGAMSALHLTGLRRLVAREFVRQTCQNQNHPHYRGPENHPDVDPSAPNAWLGGDFITDMKDITEEAKEQSGHIITALEQELGLTGDRPVPSAQPTPAPQIIITSADMYPGPIMPPDPAELDAAAERTLADAVAGAGKNPHPPGSEEAAEYAAMLADMHKSPLQLLNEETDRLAAEADAARAAETATQPEPATEQVTS